MAKGVYVGVNSASYTLRNYAPTINGTTGVAKVGNGSSTTSTSIVKYGTKSLGLTGTTSTSEVTATFSNSYPLISTHIYYMSYWFYSTVTGVTANAYWPIAEPSFGTMSPSATKTWYQYGMIRSGSSFTDGAYPIRLDFDNNKKAGTMYFDALMLIDLTEAFGSGKEPDATWCKSNIPYFTGQTTLEVAGSSGVARKVKSIYVGVDGVARKVKKIYIGDENGKARLCYSASPSAESTTITYTGNMTDEIVTMTDGQYRLLTLTSSGTLTSNETLKAEVWMCNGGNGGADGNDGREGGGGGFTTTQITTLNSSTTVVVGAGGRGAGYFGGNSSFGTVTPQGFSGAGFDDGASGGGGGGTGAEITTYPFGDTSFFVNKPHSAGGGGGGYRSRTASEDDTDEGGRGGEDGSDGYDHDHDTGGYYDGGGGGSYGGGAGGAAGEDGSNASFYGSGGGGGGYYDREWVNDNSSTEFSTTVGGGGSGYQGVIYVRIPLDQDATQYMTFTVNGTRYKARYGMTWTEYANSGIEGSYNFRIGTYVDYGIGYVVRFKYSTVSPTSEIIAGAQYTADSL